MRSHTSRVKQVLIPPGDLFSAKADRRRHARNGDSLVFLPQSTNRLPQRCFCGFNLDKVSPISPAPHTICGAGFPT
jgi:hypothetical protein